jgi:hypothetical protein
MATKYILALFIDLIIPMVPVTISYFYRNIELQNYLSFFEALGIVFFIFNNIAYLASEGNKSTVGAKISRIRYTDINKRNHLKNLLRILLISVFLFNISDLLTAMMFILVIFPMQLNYKNEICYSIIDRLLVLKIEPLEKIDTLNIKSKEKF